jgi:hypothetical protein
MSGSLGTVGAQPLGISAHLDEDVGPVGGPHRAADLTGRPAERRLTAGGQQEDLVAHVEMGQRVRHDDDDDAACIGQPTQQRHRLAVQRRVQPRGRFVQDQQRRAGEEFHGHRCAFALIT